MKYLILIYDNPASQDVWRALPREQRLAGLAVYADLNTELAETGEMIATAALADHSLTTQVRVTEGRTQTTDGPYAEAKEMLAGIYLVECTSLARALEIAARIPESQFGVVEVRPTMDLTAFQQ